MDRKGNWHVFGVKKTENNIIFCEKSLDISVLCNFEEKISNFRDFLSIPYSILRFSTFNVKTANFSTKKGINPENHQILSSIFFER